MTKSKKIIISLFVPLLLAGLEYCFYHLADAGYLGESIALLVFVPIFVLFAEHLLIGQFLYSLGIGWENTLPAAGLNKDYPLGWVLAVTIDYLILAALTYLILTVAGKLRNRGKAQ